MKKINKRKIYLILGIFPYVLWFIYAIFTFFFGGVYCDGFFTARECTRYFAFDALHQLIGYTILYVIGYWFISIPLLIFNLYFLGLYLQEKSKIRK